jgi:hypothetical protein
MPDTENQDEAYARFSDLESGNLEILKARRGKIKR